MDISGREVLRALMTTPAIIVVDDGIDLVLQVAGQAVALLQDAVHGSLWHKMPFRIRELHRKLARRQIAFLRGQVPDLLPNRLWNAVPDPRRFWGCDPPKLRGRPSDTGRANGKGWSWNAQLVQGAPSGQMRPFNQPDDLKLL